jgi:hypothetical protein
LEIIASLSERIREYDRRLEEIAEELYPETKLLCARSMVWER